MTSRVTKLLDLKLELSFCQRVQTYTKTMLHKVVENFVATPLLIHNEKLNRSRLSKAWFTMNLFNTSRFVLALVFLSLLALWGYTFWTAAEILGRLQWFHAMYTPFKYIRLAGNIYGSKMYRVKPIPSHPKYTGKDVTVIVPTIEENMEVLVSPFQSLIDTGIQELIIITVGDDNHRRCSMLAQSLLLSNPGRAEINVYSTDVKNKRTQLKAVIPKVTTKITALVDDDIWWAKTSMPWILAPLEDERIGSVGLGMAAHPLPEGRGFNLKTIWHYLGDEYLTRRNFDGASTLYHDAGISCMSGRTNILRTSILQDEAFLNAFVDERDLSRPCGPLLMNGEDKFITRWLFEHGIGTWVQYHQEAYLETTLEMDENFLHQCIRWASSSWRGNYKLLFPGGFNPWTAAFWMNVGEVGARQPWTFFAKYITVFLSWTIITDPLLFLGHNACQDIFKSAGLRFLNGTSGWILLATFFLFTKIIKKMSLYLRHPWTILFFPISLVFGLFHNWIKFKSMAEIDKGWRTRGFAFIRDTKEERGVINYIRLILTLLIFILESAFIFPLLGLRPVIKFIWSITSGCLGRQGDAARLNERDEEEMMELLPSHGKEKAVQLVSLVEEKNDFVVITCSEMDATPGQSSGVDYFS